MMEYTFQQLGYPVKATDPPRNRCSYADIPAGASGMTMIAGTKSYEMEPFASSAGGSGGWKLLYTE